MRQLFLGLVLACVMASCIPETDSSTSIFVVKGTVSTGAHTRAPLAGGYVGIFLAEANGKPWTRLLFADVASTGTIKPDGTYRFPVERWAMYFETNAPVFIAASDAAGTLTMIAEIPQDLSLEGAELTIDINPTTTVASQMICPGGVYPPPANTWCYSDPNTPSVDTAERISIIDDALAKNLIALETGSPPRWDTFARGFLNDPATFTALKDNLTGHGVPFGTATPASIAATIAAAPFPPVTAGSTSGSSSSGGSSSGGGSCKLVWDCRSSSHCAQVYGKPTGSAAQPNLATCQSTCKAQGACTCQGC
jgi:hypothetical protein